MKPYRNTYRASKLHKASECGICSEAVDKSPSPIRQQAKRQIEAEDLRPDSIAQAEHDSDEDFHKFSEEYQV